MVTTQLEMKLQTSKEKIHTSQIETCELLVHSVKTEGHLFKYLLHEERGITSKVRITLHWGQMDFHAVDGTSPKRTMAEGFQL